MSAMNALIVMAKRPAAGQTKTRLCPPLTPSRAAGLYECFLRDTIALMRQVPGVQPLIAYLPAGETLYFQQLAPDFDLVQQVGESLGERLDNVIGACLKAGYRHVVAIDSDSPTLPAAYLQGAFDVLAGGSDVVLGPCDDGGYYLIGFTRPAPRLLREVRMSTPDVTADTLALAEEVGLEVGMLPRWYDVDDAQTLARLSLELETAPEGVAVNTRRFLGRFPKKSVHIG